MANRKNFTMTESQRRMRHFSTNFKIEKVREIERGLSRVSEICKQYEVSTSNVYRWMTKFGSMKSKKERLIVETDSDTRELLALKQKIAELEQVIGQKQLLIDFKDKMIDLAEQTYGVDIKKKFTTKPSGSTGSTGNNTPSA